MADGTTKPRARFKWRPWLRALHRDLGYLAVGLTMVYALSGLAVNHISDWDPNFTQLERELQVAAPLPDDDQEAAAQVMGELHITEEPLDVYRVSETELELAFAERTLHVDPQTGRRVRGGPGAAGVPARGELAALEPRQAGVDVVRRRLRDRIGAARDLGAVHDPGSQGSARSRCSAGNRRRSAAARVSVVRRGP